MTKLLTLACAPIGQRPRHVTAELVQQITVGSDPERDAPSRRLN